MVTVVLTLFRVVDGLLNVWGAMNPNQNNRIILREDGKRENTSIYHVGNGYYYHFHRETVTTIYFQCVQSNRGCLGRAIFKLGTILQHTTQHDHPPNLFYHEYLSSRRNIIAETKVLNYVSFVDIIEAERNRSHLRASEQLTYRSLRSAMQRARASVFPPLPHSFGELTAILEDPAWQHLSKTEDCADSMYCGHTIALDGSHSILFISSRFIEVLKMALIVFADATYFTSPSIEGCYQVLTLVIMWSNTVIPVAWCLMERKSEAAYVSVFMLLRAALRQWEFTKAICDFEDALVNALQAVFNVEVQGCLFHCVQAMGSYARSHLTIPVLQYYPLVKEVVHCCCVLPLLPQHLLQRGLNVLGREAMALGPIMYDILRPFLAYVQKEWLDHATRGKSMSVCNSCHRTNNACECNNRRMKRKFGVHHPNIYYFIRKLANFEAKAKSDIESLRCGIIPNRHRSVKSVANDERIRRLTVQLLQVPVPTDEQISAFLHQAAFSVTKVFHEVIQILIPGNGN